MKLSNTLAPAEMAVEATQGLTGWLKRRVAAFEARRSNKALRRQLAEMDDVLLRDIGIADDEIWRVRQGHMFRPRAWR
jgi:uncharacterized protein YjiS (DUF1127 family)